MLPYTSRPTTEGRSPGRLNSTTRSARHVGIAVAVLILAPLLFYATMVFRGWEPPAPDTVAHSPVGDWALSTEAELGTRPEWFPHILSGMPAYGSFLYIPRPDSNVLGQFLVLFSGNRGIRYVILFGLAGVLTLAFLLRQGFSVPAAAAGALLYSMTPYFPGLVAAGHSTKLEALAIAPGVLWAFDWLLSRPGPLPALFLGYLGALLAWANHPQIAYYVAMICLVYFIGRAILDARTRWLGMTGIRILAYGVLAAILALALVAEPYLEIQEYMHHSIRGAASVLSAEGEAGGSTGWEYATNWSFPPREWITFFFPAWYGLEGATYWGRLPFTQSSHYFGILALLLSALGLWKGRRRERWIWFAVSVLLLLIGFGRNFAALYRPLYDFLPLFDRFRVPSMIYSLIPLTLAYLIASGIETVGQWATISSGRSGGEPASGAAANDSGPSRKKRRDERKHGSPPVSAWLSPARLGLVVGGLVALWVLILLVTRGIYGDPSAMVRPGEAERFAGSLAQLKAQRMSLLSGTLAHGFLFVLFAVVAVWGTIKAAPPRFRSLGAALAVGFLAVLDVWIVDLDFYDPQPKITAEQLIPLPGASRFLAEQPGPFRIFPVNPHFRSNSFTTAGLESVGGYQPAKLRRYDDLIESGILTAPGVLSMLNVQYLVAPQPVQVGAEPVYSGGGRDGFVYPLPPTPGSAWSAARAVHESDGRSVLTRLGDATFDPRAVAYFSGESVPKEGDYAPARVELLERGVHRLRWNVEAEGQSLIVMSETFYEPGWHATLDGAEVPIYPANHVLRSVVVPEGSHLLELNFRSEARTQAATLVRAGWGLFLGLLALTLIQHLRRRRETSHEGAAGEPSQS